MGAKRPLRLVIYKVVCLFFLPFLPLVNIFFFNKLFLFLILVYFRLVKNGFDYSPFWDASTKNDSIEGYKAAMKLFNKAMSSAKTVDAPAVVNKGVNSSKEVSTEAAEDVAKIILE